MHVSNVKGLNTGHPLSDVILNEGSVSVISQIWSTEYSVQSREIDSGRIDLPTPITGQRLSSTNPAIFEYQKSGDMSG